jgi:hypothetical protein
MEFLYNLNRFNVATSRARCACIVAGSPRLFSPECCTPRQMELANVLCRYAEMSEIVAFGSLARDRSQTIFLPSRFLSGSVARKFYERFGL